MKWDLHIFRETKIIRAVGLRGSHRSCGRAREAAPPLYPSENSDTRPARTQAVSDWTAVQPSTLPGAKKTERTEQQVTMSWHVTLVKSECEVSVHHDFHGTPAWGSPVHRHPLVYYKRHGPHNFCKSHQITFMLSHFRTLWQLLCIQKTITPDND